MSDPVRSQYTMGSAMFVGMWVMLLILLTLFFQGWLHSGDNPNRGLASYDPDGLGEVVLERNRSGHYIAPGFINGEPVQFLLDTGATDVNIPAAIASRIGLSRGQAQRAMTANGIITVYRTQLDEVRLGNIALPDVRASINPHMPGDIVLLGMSFMRDLEMIQRDNTLTLRQY